MNYSLIAILLLCSLSEVFAQPDKLRKSIPELPFATLEKAGFNRDSIQNLLDLIHATPPNDFRGLVVIKNNQIVIEEYFSTYWRNTVHDVRSAGKSITSLLLGVAMNDGLIESLDQDIYSFFPKDKYPTINEDYRSITLRHLLNMSSGLDADTDDSRTTGHAVNWIALDDWKEVILNVPLDGKPGKRWVYADINAVLIGAVIEELTGVSLRDYADKKVFAPLGIKQYYWYTNESNQTGAAGNIYLTALDFAKLGVLITNEGKWKGEQIVSPAYLDELSSPVFDLSEDNPFADHYVNLWYQSNRTFGENEVNYLFASGNGGNHLVIIPEKEMVVALISSAYGPGPGHRRSYNIMSKVIAAME